MVRIQNDLDQRYSLRGYLMDEHGQVVSERNSIASTVPSMTSKTHKVTAGTLMVADLEVSDLVE